ncbi:MAG: FKBP-type peptidyl-prolyl cis-trans isomerase [Thermomonas sp.]
MKTITLLSLALMATLAGCQPVGKDEEVSGDVTRLETERDRVSYMVGLDVAKNLDPIKQELDLAIVDAAIRDALAGRKSLLDPAQVDATRTAFSARLRETREMAQQALGEKNLAAGKAFLAKNAQQTGVQSTPSGLQYQAITQGTGNKPSQGDTVRVHYVGTLLDGREFENTRALDHDAAFALNQIAPGLREALMLMPVGSKYRLWIPSELAYAGRGVPGAIGPNETLVFEIELLEIAKS